MKARPTRERDRIQDQLERAFQGDAWHGPSVREVLEGVTWQQALLKPIPRAHSIWELVLHITAWEDIVRRRLQGESPEITDDENWPPIRDESAAGWDKALAALRDGHARLRETAASVSDDLLDLAPTAKTSTRYILLHGIIQHDIYHAGQIALLKK